MFVNYNIDSIRIHIFTLDIETYNNTIITCAVKIGVILKNLGIYF